MPHMGFGEAIDRAVATAMAEDERVIVMGEDVHLIRSELLARFGSDRVLNAPISEGAFVGAAVAAAMAGQRPIAELIMVDFVAVAMDAVLNHMAKTPFFSGGAFDVPLVLRAPCGAGYGDGGQHGQALWGMLASIPGLTVVVPSTPEDGSGLMTAAIAHDGPVIFLEHKLLSALWLDSLGGASRATVRFDVPPAGAEGEVPSVPIATPFGVAAIRKSGDDLTIASLGVGVHRSLAAAGTLAEAGLSAEVLDLRTVRPLDVDTICASVGKTGRLLVVDEDYREFGLSGELAATVLEAGLRPAFGRVCVEDTLPYARDREARALPNVERIEEAARRLCD